MSGFCYDILEGSERRFAEWPGPGILPGQPCLDAELQNADGGRRGHAASNVAFRQVLTAGEGFGQGRSEEQTSEIQALMRISDAVVCSEKKKKKIKYRRHGENSERDNTS